MGTCRGVGGDILSEGCRVITGYGGGGRERTRGAVRVGVRVRVGVMVA